MDSQCPGATSVVSWKHGETRRAVAVYIQSRASPAEVQPPHPTATGSNSQETPWAGTCMSTDAFTYEDEARRQEEAASDAAVGPRGRCCLLEHSVLRLHPVEKQGVVTFWYCKHPFLTLGGVPLHVHPPSHSAPGAHGKQLSDPLLPSDTPCDPALIPPPPPTSGPPHSAKLQMTRWLPLPAGSGRIKPVVASDLHGNSDSPCNSFFTGPEDIASDGRDQRLCRVCVHDSPASVPVPL